MPIVISSPLFSALSQDSAVAEVMFQFDVDSAPTRIGICYNTVGAPVVDVDGTIDFDGNPGRWSGSSVMADYRSGNDIHCACVCNK